MHYQTLDCVLVLLLEQGGKSCGPLLVVSISPFNPGPPMCEVGTELGNIENKFVHKVCLVFEAYIDFNFYEKNLC